jgi:hypothetical protein
MEPPGWDHPPRFPSPRKTTRMKIKETQEEIHAKAERDMVA